MEKAQVRLIKSSSNFTDGWCPKTEWSAALNKYIIYSCGSISMASNEDVQSVRHPAPPIVQKSKHQSSQPRFQGHLLLSKKGNGDSGRIPKDAKEGFQRRPHVTGLVLLKQNDGAISASHTSRDRRAPQLTLGAII